MFGDWYEQLLLVGGYGFAGMMLPSKENLILIL
jgi:hypothetical protein